MRSLPLFVLFLAALVLRLGQQHSALIYPDGYQYLLMARGISEHLQPTTVLGSGGDRFVPNPDAALKPFFPLLVAAFHTSGVSWLRAAQGVTATAGAATVAATALLATRVGRSRVAGCAAGLLVLASPNVAFWSGFSGPDPLAQALALCAAVAFVDRRERLGGILTGFAIVTRPEIVLVAAVAGILARRDPRTRVPARRAALAAVATVASVFAVLRPPVSVHDPKLMALLVLASTVLGAVLLLGKAPSGRVPFTVLAWAALATSVGALLVSPGLVEVARGDWPLAGLALAGAVVLLRDASRRSATALVVTAALLLGAVYVLKNAALERYFALELPLAAVLAGAATATLGRRGRPLAAGVVAIAVVVGIFHPIRGSRDRDVFSVIGASLKGTLAPRETLLTAAPDAYGFWLPGQPVRALRVGAHGMVLLDAAQRAYAPELTARGTVVKRVSGSVAFARPDGQLDARPAVLLRGSVALRR